jgi:protein-disulfide isomerase
MSHVSHEQQNTVWFGISMVLIGVIAGYVLALLTAANPVSAPTPREQPVPTVQAPEQLQDAANVVPVDLSKDHIRGNKNARIALIEYSDMECPYCKAVHPTYKQIIDQYGDKVMWVYRHFPLDFHANAMKQAEASECVAEIGGEDAFWKYVDAIYDRTQSGGQGFPLSELGPLAAEIGVNQGRFQACLDSGGRLPLN